MSEDLVSQISACKICTDLPLGPRPLMQYDEAALILLAGHAPGRLTHQAGRAFDDASGRRLRDWLGVSKAEFYNPKLFAILPMGFCYPGRQVRGDLPPRPICAQTWREPLMARLKNLQLTLTLGRYAQHWHDPKRSQLSVTERARSFSKTLPQLAHLPHPSPRNNLWLKRNPWFETEALPTIRQCVDRILSGEDKNNRR